MAITVTLYSFTKRENSTKQPTGGGTDYSCTMIDDTSLMNPTFKLSIASNPIGKNYAYVADFNRYYFITDIRTFQNFWYISCTCDVLASFKTAIGTGSHYVLRSASDYDGDIEDTIYPCNTNVSTFIDYPVSDPLAWSGGHCFVLGIVGYKDEVTSQFGAVRYYIFKDAGLKKFLQYLMDNIADPNDGWSGILTTEYSEGVQKALINPIEYIKTCICMPFSYDQVTGNATSTVKFGYYEYNVPSGDDYKVKTVSQTNVCKTKEIVNIDLRDHPQAATRGSYLNCQPYTRYALHYGPWGDIDLDPMALKDDNQVMVETLYDLVSGVGRLIVSGNVNTANILFNGSVKVGVDVNLSQVYKDALGYEAATTKTLFGSVAAGAAIGASPLSNAVADIANGLSFITAGVQDMTRLNYPTVSGTGASGCFIQFHDPKNLYVISRFNEIVDENLAEIGRPLCQTKVINTLSGYILCQLADCQISGTQEEAQKINSYMNTGFFYE